MAWASFVALPLLAGGRSLHPPEPYSLPGNIGPQRLQRDGEMVSVHNCWLWEAVQTQDQLLFSESLELYLFGSLKYI